MRRRAAIDVLAAAHPSCSPQLLAPRHSLLGLTVLELGAGTGGLGLAASVMGRRCSSSERGRCGQQPAAEPVDAAARQNPARPLRAQHPGKLGEL
eukprot:SAG22_NODE_363_length_11694_cov_40.815783_10_plen_95_part_00